MEEKELTKAQEMIVKSVQRCKKRFEKIEKKLQQPWRNSSSAIKEVHENIKHLDDLFPKVGKSTNVQVKTLVYITNTMALLMESRLKRQNMQKTDGE
jgi:hypothetical protein